MRIDPKYFNRFMAVVAAVAALLIVIATVSYISGRKSAFRNQMQESEQLSQERFARYGSQDSLTVSQYRGTYLLLDFWAPWSEPSTESHKALATLREQIRDSLRVIAAAVRTDSSEVAAYRRAHNYPFIFVDGTDFYRRRNLPGVPSQILFDRDGRVIETFVGYTDSTRYQRIATLLSDD